MTRKVVSMTHSVVKKNEITLNEIAPEPSTIANSPPLPTRKAVVFGNVFVVGGVMVFGNVFVVGDVVVAFVPVVVGEVVVVTGVVSSLAAVVVTE